MITHSLESSKIFYENQQSLIIVRVNLRTCWTDLWSWCCLEVIRHNGNCRLKPQPFAVNDAMISSVGHILANNTPDHKGYGGNTGAFIERAVENIFDMSKVASPAPMSSDRHQLRPKVAGADNRYTEVYFSSRQHCCTVHSSELKRDDWGEPETKRGMANKKTSSMGV
jgi:hypothetical protein